MCRAKSDGGRRCTPHLQKQLDAMRAEAGVSHFTGEDPLETMLAIARAHPEFLEQEWEAMERDARAHRNHGSYTMSAEDKAAWGETLERLIAARQVRKQLAEERREAKAAEDAERVWSLEFDGRSYTGFVGAGFTDSEWVAIQEEARARGYEDASKYLKDVARQPLSEENLEGVRSVNGRIIHDSKIDPVDRGNSPAHGRHPAQERDAETEEELHSANSRGKVTDYRHTRKVRLSPEAAAVLYAKASVFGNTVSDQLRYEALGFDPRKGENHRGRSERPGFSSTTAIRLKHFRKVEEGLKNPRDVYLTYQRAVAAKLASWGRDITGRESLLADVINLPGVGGGEQAAA